MNSTKQIILDDLHADGLSPDDLQRSIYDVVSAAVMYKSNFDLEVHRPHIAQLYLLYRWLDKIRQSRRDLQ